MMIGLGRAEITTKRQRIYMDIVTDTVAEASAPLPSAVLESSLPSSMSPAFLASSATFFRWATSRASRGSWVVG